MVHGATCLESLPGKTKVLVVLTFFEYALGHGHPIPPISCILVAYLAPLVLMRPLSSVHYMS